MPKADDMPKVRFIFVVFTPSENLMFDHLEIGRSMATLLSNEEKNVISFVEIIKLVFRTINT